MTLCIRAILMRAHHPILSMNVHIYRTPQDAI